MWKQDVPTPRICVPKGAMWKESWCVTPYALPEKCSWTDHLQISCARGLHIFLKVREMAKKNLLWPLVVFVYWAVLSFQAWLCLAVASRTCSSCARWGWAQPEQTSRSCWGLTESMSSLRFMACVHHRTQKSFRIVQLSSKGEVRALYHQTQCLPFL